MDRLTDEEAFKMGAHAFQRGLPGAPVLNKEFWEKNCVLTECDWKKNMQAYNRGWFSEQRRKCS